MKYKKYLKYVFVIISLVVIWIVNIYMSPKENLSYYVKIAGAVDKPGIYKLQKGEVLAKALILSKLKNNADVSKINLVTQGTKQIYIPYQKSRKYEFKNYSQVKNKKYDSKNLFTPSPKMYVTVNNYYNQTTKPYKTTYQANVNKFTPYFKRNQAYSKPTYVKPVFSTKGFTTQKKTYNIKKYQSKNKIQYEKKKIKFRQQNDKYDNLKSNSTQQMSYNDENAQKLNNLKAKIFLDFVNQAYLNKIKNVQSNSVSKTIKKQKFKKPQKYQEQKINFYPNVGKIRHYTFEAQKPRVNYQNRYNQRLKNQYNQLQHQYINMLHTAAQTPKVARIYVKQKPRIITKYRKTQLPQTKHYENPQQYMCDKYQNKIKANNKFRNNPNFINGNDFILDPNNKKSYELLNKFKSLYKKYSNFNHSRDYDNIYRYIQYQRDHKLYNFCELYYNNILIAKGDYEIVTNFLQLY